MTRNLRRTLAGCVLGSLALAAGRAPAAESTERYLDLALRLCGNVGRSVAEFEERAAAIKNLKIGAPAPLTDKVGHIRNGVTRVLGVKPEEPIHVAIIDAQPQFEVLAFLRTDYRACVATQRGDSEAAGALQARLNAPDSGWDEIISARNMRSWQRQGAAGQVITMMTLKDGEIAIAGVTLDLGAMPHAAVYDKFAALVVPQCLAAVIEQRPLDAASLAPHVLPAKKKLKDASLLVQQDMPGLEILVRNGKPGCGVTPGIATLDTGRLREALAGAFLAQPGAEVVESHGLATPGALVWRIRGQQAYMVIVTEPEFLAIFSRAPE
jgi:hypothetical protein